MSLLERASAIRSAASEAARAAAHDETLAAIVTIAAAAREVTPEAAYVPLTRSEAGDWFNLTGEILDRRGEPIVDAEDWDTATPQGKVAETAASNIYEATEQFLIAFCSEAPAAQQLNRTSIATFRLNVDAVLSGAEAILTSTTTPAPQAEPVAEGLPALIYTSDAFEAWTRVLDTMRGWNATLDLGEGSTVEVQIVGSDHRESDGIVGLVYKRITDPNAYRPAEGSEEEFVSCEDFVSLTVH